MILFKNKQNKKTFQCLIKLQDLKLYIVTPKKNMVFPTSKPMHKYSFIVYSLKSFSLSYIVLYYQ